MDKKIVLAVDDVSMNLVIIKNILSDEYDVRIAKSAGFALQILQKLKADLILLDIEMPEMNGFDFMEALLSNPDTKDIPVICITSHPEDEIKDKIAEYGIKHCMPRPINNEKLKNNVKLVLS